MDKNLISIKESLLLLKKYNFNYPDVYIIDNKVEIKNLNLKFPVVLKIDSNEIIHKSDFGFVFTNINSYLELHKKIDLFETKIKEKKIQNYNFVIQEMVFGKELILGLKTDKTFGKTILLGLGGIFTEVLKDISMRILPIKKEDCYEMISELKGKKILENYRNTKAINFDNLAETILNFSTLCLNETFDEIDFNPLICNENKCYVVDARFILNNEINEKLNNERKELPKFS
ncbi:MAG: acetate--CoA ligase family protein [Candidatus Woesearchaeota archaeon]